MFEAKKSPENSRSISVISSKRPLGIALALFLLGSVIGCKPLSENKPVPPVETTSTPVPQIDSSSTSEGQAFPLPSRYRLSIETPLYGGGVLTMYTDQRPVLNVWGSFIRVSAVNVNCPPEQNTEFSGGDVLSASGRRAYALDKLNCKGMMPFYETYTPYKIDVIDQTGPQ